MTQMALDFEPTFKIAQVAEILQVKNDTVRHWRDRGLIDVLVLPGGEVRVPATELKRLMAESLRPRVAPRRPGPRKKVTVATTSPAMRDYKSAAAGDCE